MYTPPGTPRSRSFARLTMRVGFLHLGQSVDFVVSISFLRSPVFAILAIGRVVLLLWVSLHTRTTKVARGFKGAVIDCLKVCGGSGTRSDKFTSRAGGTSSAELNHPAAWVEETAAKNRRAWPVARGWQRVAGRLQDWRRAAEAPFSAWGTGLASLLRSFCHRWGVFRQDFAGWEVRRALAYRGREPRRPFEPFAGLGRVE